MKKVTSILLCTFLLICLTACGARTKCDKDCSCGESCITTPESQEGEYDTQEDSEGDFKSDNEIEAKSKADSISQISNTHSSGFKDNPEISIDSDDPIVIAKEYARLFNLDECTGYPTTYKGFKVSEPDGEIYINDEPTGIKTDERIFYDEIVEMYLNETWDGTERQYKSHTIELSPHGGYVLVDGYITCIQHNLDFPENITDSDFEHCTSFIPTKGTYTIINNTLVKYQRGKLISLEGCPLMWEGFDTNTYAPYYKELYYDEASDTLFLIINTMPKAKDDMIALAEKENRFFSNKERKIVEGVGVYLYIIPDYNISKIKFVGEISGLLLYENGLAYRNTHNTFYQYQPQENGTYKFTKIPNDKNMENWCTIYEIFCPIDHCGYFSPFRGYYCCQWHECSMCSALEKGCCGCCKNFFSTY